MRRISAIALIVLAIVALVLVQLRTTKAQDAAGPLSPPPAATASTDVVDQMMNLIGQNRIDDATLLMGNLKSLPDVRNVARDQLIHLRDDQGAYHGYDIASVQRFTANFETDNVIAYYDQQPVLIRIHFYRTDGKSGWNVLGFQVVTSLPELVEMLKDTPVEYHHK
jgi:hypothetical protein